MKKGTAISVRSEKKIFLSGITTLKGISKFIHHPLTTLSIVYSLLMGEDISKARTLRLLHAQTAVILALMSAEAPMAIHIILLAWAAFAIIRCITPSGKAKTLEKP